MKQRLHILLMLVIAALTASARDFEYEGIIYTVLDEEAKTVSTKRGSYFEVALEGPNDKEDCNNRKVSGSLILPSNPKDGEVEYKLTIIGAAGFEGANLTSITIPNTVIYIGGYAFLDCVSLKKVIFEDSQKIQRLEDRLEIGSELNLELDSDNGILVIASDAFRGVELDEIYLGRELISYEPITRSIDIKTGPSPFNDMTEFSVVVGSSFTFIPSVLSGCSGLTSIKLPNSVSSIGESAFSNCSGLKSIIIPDSVSSIGKEAFLNCTGMTSIEIPESVTTIGYGAFSGCRGLEKAEFASIKALCEMEFDSGDSNPLAYAHHLYIDGEEVRELEIPEEMTVIKKYTFNQCQGITSVAIPESVTSIGESSFQGCSGLTSVEIPNSVTSIETGAFEGCSGMASVSLGNSVNTIGSYAFQGCKSLISVKIPTSVTTIGGGVFYDCSALTSVDLPNSVTSFGEGVFEKCSSLVSIKLPNSLKSVPYRTFYRCSNLTSVEIPNSVLIIEEDSFMECEKLANIRIPDSVTVIEEYAFEDCRELATLELSASLESIGDYAFRGCTGLKNVYYGATRPINTPAENIFDNEAYSNATLWVPESSVELYQRVNPWRNFYDIKPFDYTSGVENIVLTPDSEDDFESDGLADTAEIYTLDGIRIYETPKNLAPGVYIIRQGNESRKISVK